MGEVLVVLTMTEAGDREGTGRRREEGCVCVTRR